MTQLANRRLDIDALRALRTIAQLGGVTRAAEALGLSQSAVSHKIRRLEASLDCALLDRGAGPALFTAAGQELVDYAGRILGLHDEALLSLTRSALVGRLQLGLTEDTTCSDLARILGRFARLHPQVSVRTRVRMSLVLRDLLEAGEIDLAVLQLFAHEVRPTDQVLFSEPLHWVKAPDLVLPEEGPIPFIAFDAQCFYRRWAMDMGQDGGALLETVFECSSAAGVIAAVRAGLGVALLNARHLHPEMQRLQHPALPPPPEVVYAIRRARRVRNPALEALVAEIARELGRQGRLALSA